MDFDKTFMIGKNDTRTTYLKWADPIIFFHFVSVVVVVVVR